MKPRSYGPFPYSPIIDRPRLEWPNGAHVALWIIPNIEYFSMLEKPGGYGAGAKLPDVVMWSERDYGNRVGVFRIMDTLDRYGIRGTVALNSNLCAEHPRIMEEGEKRKWEWMGHNESNTRRLNEAGPGRGGTDRPQHLCDDREGDRQAPQAAGSAPGCRKPGTRSTIWSTTAASMSPTGATTISPIR